MYTSRTRGIEVSVEPFYLESQSDPGQGRWVFGYKVTIANLGREGVQLLTRHWQITDALGRLVEVRGEGVVGEQPRLRPGERFSYTSGTPLPTPTGFMAGSYGMLGQDGASFDVAIPSFPLDVPAGNRKLH